MSNSGEKRSAEYKAQIVEFHLDDGQSIGDLAREFGIRHSEIEAWVHDCQSGRLSWGEKAGNRAESSEVVRPIVIATVGTILIIAVTSRFLAPYFAYLNAAVPGLSEYLIVALVAGCGTPIWLAILYVTRKRNAAAEGR